MFEPTEYNRKKIFAGNTQPRNIGSGLIYGADLQAGSVVASRGVATSATKAKKSVTFTGTPVASKTIKVAVNGKEVTYTTASTTLATEVAGIKAAINGDSALSAIVTADNSSGKLTIEWKEAGLAGNDMVIVVTVGDGAGVEAGAVAVETIGQSVGDELFEIADSDSGTASLQDPVGVLIEDAAAGTYGTIAFTGEVDVAELKFAEGDSINNFLKALRKIGIFPRTVNE